MPQVYTYWTEVFPREKRITYEICYMLVTLQFWGCLFISGYYGIRVKYKWLYKYVRCLQRPLYLFILALISDNNKCYWAEKITSVSWFSYHISIEPLLWMFVNLRDWCHPLEILMIYCCQVIFVFFALNSNDRMKLKKVINDWAFHAYQYV